MGTTSRTRTVYPDPSHVDHHTKHKRVLGRCKSFATARCNIAAWAKINLDALAADPQGLHGEPRSRHSRWLRTLMGTIILCCCCLCLVCSEVVAVRRKAPGECGTMHDVGPSSACRHSTTTAHVKKETLLMMRSGEWENRHRPRHAQRSTDTSHGHVAVTSLVFNCPSA